MREVTTIGDKNSDVKAQVLSESTDLQIPELWDAEKRRWTQIFMKIAMKSPSESAYSACYAAGVLF